MSKRPTLRLTRSPQRRGPGAKHQQLLAGARYRVVREFRDYDGHIHAAGGSWKFMGLSFFPTKAGQALFVSLDGKQEWHMPLQWRPEAQGEIIDELEKYVVEEIQQRVQQPTRETRALELMSCIGLICRASATVEDLPLNWEPEALGTREEVLAAVAECVPQDRTDLAINISIDEGPAPKAISVSGVWSDKERSVVKALCRKLGARFYDAEACEFVNL